MRLTTVSSFMAPVLAFLAGQHHLIHMLLITTGIGSAGMSSMLLNTTLRRLMLGLSLVMVLLTVRRLMRPHMPLQVRLLSAGSALLTLVLLVWTTVQFGF